MLESMPNLTELSAGDKDTLIVRLFVCRSRRFAGPGDLA